MIFSKAMLVFVLNGNKLILIKREKYSCFIKCVKGDRRTLKFSLV